MKLKTKKQMGSAAVAIIAATLVLEGGYVNHPNDPGGETNKGITIGVARKHDYYGPMKTIPDEIVYGIYYQSYLVEPGFEPLIKINGPVVSELYDTGVNMGPNWPGKFLQQSISNLCSIKVTVDGRVGPATIKAFSDCQRNIGPVRFCIRMLDALDARQKARYDYLVRVNPKLKVFYKGWINHRIGNVSRSQCQTRISA